MNPISDPGDPGSLENLYDIVEPLPVSLWWPLAPGWWVILFLIILLTTWVMIRWWKKWSANVYRRQALKELSQIENINRISTLLKRTALAACSRERVASLSGKKWINFLNKGTSDVLFNDEMGQLLQTAAYTSEKPDGSKKSDLMAAAKKWIIMHKLS
jgi:hypothetical protein